MGLALKIKASKRPFVIAGPCSVETEEQVRKTISDLALNNQVAMIRGGIWNRSSRFTMVS
jgi:chorismate mutase